MLPAIVLAGGASSRMGQPKALLPAPDGLPFVVRIVRTLEQAGALDVVVVTGFEHASIVEALAAAGAPGTRVVRNPDPARGQLSSLWCGLDAIDTSAAAVLMTLIDVPLIQPSTVSAVVARWQATGAPIVRPLFDGRRGHPVVFDRAVFDALRTAPIEKGARAVVEAYRAESVDVAVDDPGCIADVDTMDDYRRLRV
ncbi:MAG TPA: nucleotidyltransferase family protein [Vicinamibacterales bacterium]|nr:nucleotidyltransferase family protein [Vicinamibacterales bacterium]